MDVAITRMSSKGQIVIPVEMRNNIKEGEKLVIIQNEDQYIMKKANKFDKNLTEDLEFAKKTDEALKRISKGVKMNFDDFMSDIKKW